MSTRGVIARLVGAPPVDSPLGAQSPQFFGRYHHWDSYPSGLGHTLWELYHEQFQCDLEAMSWVLIDEHPAGWSTINGADFRLTAGFTEPVAGFASKENSVEGESRSVAGNSQEEGAAPSSGVRPECYCHGDRSEAAWNVTEKNAAGSGCEWAYAFVRGDTPQHDIMVILSSFRPSGRKMIGCFGQGDPQSVWQIIAVIALQGQEPDWEALNRASPLKPLGAVKTIGAVESASNGTGSRRRASSQTQTQTLAKPDAQARSVARTPKSGSALYRQWNGGFRLGSRHSHAALPATKSAVSK